MAANIDVYIAVVGHLRAGKTTFIQCCTNKDDPPAYLWTTSMLVVTRCRIRAHIYVQLLLRRLKLGRSNTKHKEYTLLTRLEYIAALTESNIPLAKLVKN
jgi:hypothetical protein